MENIYLEKKNFIEKIVKDNNKTYEEKIKEISKLLGVGTKKAKKIYARIRRENPQERVPIEVIIEINKNQFLTKSQKVKIISTKYKIPRSTVYDWLNKLEQTNKEIQIKETPLVNHTNKKEKIIVTSCQNNTPVYKKFFDNLIEYANHINAEIVVIPLRYHNPTSILSYENKKTDYDYELKKYIIEEEFEINNTKIYGNIKTQLTNSNPIANIYPENNNIIIGHPKLFFKKTDKFNILTTGISTIKNYIDSRTGKLSEKFHKFGFVLIDKDETIQVEADNDGNFFNKTTYVENNTIKETNEVSAVVLGDIHAIHIDESSHKKNLEIIKKLNPEYVVLHDVFDGYSINHHQLNNHFYSYEIYKKNITLKEEIEITLNIINDIYQISNKIVFPYSNHDDFFKKWLMKQNLTNELFNIKDYLKFYDILLDSYFKNVNFVHEIIKSKFNDKSIFLKNGESFIINKYELGFHGDNIFGYKAYSPLNYKKIRDKIIVGHYHTPSRYNDIISVGTSSKTIMYYNNSVSTTCSYGTAIIYKNGTVQIIEKI